MLSSTAMAVAAVLILAAALASIILYDTYKQRTRQAGTADSECCRKRLKDLVRLCESTAWSNCPEGTNQRIVDALAEVLECDEVVIHLLAVTGDYLTHYATHGAIPPDGMRVSITTGRMAQLLQDHQPIIMDLMHPHPNDRIPKLAYELGIKSAMSVPLIAGHDILGMFSINYKQHKDWTEPDIDYLLDIGRLLGISVQHAQTAQKTTDLEILMERKRLSGELHDNLSQLISSLNLGAEAALLSCEEGNAARVRSDLERIRSTGQEAVQKLREEMLSLRSPTNETEELIPMVKECVERFERQWGIKTNLEVKLCEKTLVVSKQTELQLVRILQESLSNVLRHATAAHVAVLVESRPDWLLMQIQDDGHGFDPEAVSSERLGLRIMRERAESLGGAMTIESDRASGTTIRVRVPQN